MGVVKEGKKPTHEDQVNEVAENEGLLSLNSEQTNENQVKNLINLIESGKLTWENIIEKAKKGGIYEFAYELAPDYVKDYVNDISKRTVGQETNKEEADTWLEGLMLLAMAYKRYKGYGTLNEVFKDEGFKKLVKKLSKDEIKVGPKGNETESGDYIYHIGNAFAGANLMNGLGINIIKNEKFKKAYLENAVEELEEVFKDLNTNNEIYEKDNVRRIERRLFPAYAELARSFSAVVSLDRLYSAQEDHSKVKKILGISEDQEVTKWNILNFLKERRINISSKNFLDDFCDRMGITDENLQKDVKDMLGRTLDDAYLSYYLSIYNNSEIYFHLKEDELKYIKEDMKFRLKRYFFFKWLGYKLQSYKPEEQERILAIYQNVFFNFYNSLSDEQRLKFIQDFDIQELMSTTEGLIKNKDFRHKPFKEEYDEIVNNVYNLKSFNGQITKIEKDLGLTNDNKLKILIALGVNVNDIKLLTSDNAEATITDMYDFLFGKSFVSDVLGNENVREELRKYLGIKDKNEADAALMSLAKYVTYKYIAALKQGKTPKEAKKEAEEDFIFYLMAARSIYKGEKLSKSSSEFMKFKNTLNNSYPYLWKFVNNVNNELPNINSSDSEQAAMLRNRYGRFLNVLWGSKEASKIGIYAALLVYIDNGFLDRLKKPNLLSPTDEMILRNLKSKGIIKVEDSKYDSKYYYLITKNKNIILNDPETTKEKVKEAINDEIKGLTNEMNENIINEVKSPKGDIRFLFALLNSTDPAQITVQIAPEATTVQRGINDVKKNLERFFNSANFSDSDSLTIKGWWQNYPQNYPQNIKSGIYKPIIGDEQFPNALLENNYDGSFSVVKPIRLNEGYAFDNNPLNGGGVTSWDIGFFAFPSWLIGNQDQAKAFIKAAKEGKLGEFYKRIMGDKTAQLKNYFNTFKYNKKELSPKTENYDGEVYNYIRSNLSTIESQLPSDLKNNLNVAAQEIYLGLGEKVNIEDIKAVLLLQFMVEHNKLGIVEENEKATFDLNTFLNNINKSKAIVNAESLQTLIEGNENLKKFIKEQEGVKKLSIIKRDGTKEEYNLSYKNGKLVIKNNEGNEVNNIKINFGDDVIISNNSKLLLTFNDSYSFDYFFSKDEDKVIYKNNINFATFDDGKIKTEAYKREIGVSPVHAAYSIPIMVFKKAKIAKEEKKGTPKKEETIIPVAPLILTKIPPAFYLNLPTFYGWNNPEVLKITVFNTSDYLGSAEGLSVRVPTLLSRLNEEIKNGLIDLKNLPSDGIEINTEEWNISIGGKKITSIIITKSDNSEYPYKITLYSKGDGSLSLEAKSKEDVEKLLSEVMKVRKSIGIGGEVISYEKGPISAFINAQGVWGANSYEQIAKDILTGSRPSVLNVTAGINYALYRTNNVAFNAGILGIGTSANGLVGLPYTLGSFSYRFGPTLAAPIKIGGKTSFTPYAGYYMGKGKPSLGTGVSFTYDIGKPGGWMVSSGVGYSIFGAYASVSLYDPNKFLLEGISLIYVGGIPIIVPKLNFGDLFKGIGSLVKKVFGKKKRHFIKANYNIVPQPTTSTGG